MHVSGVSDEYVIGNPELEVAFNLYAGPYSRVAIAGKLIVCGLGVVAVGVLFGIGVVLGEGIGVAEALAVGEGVGVTTGAE